MSVRTVILLWIIAGYLCGSISWARIAGRLARVDIVGDSADGNSGGANVFLMVGKTAGVLVVLLDIAKGALPVWLFNRYVGFTEPLSMFVLSAPVAGHAWPVFHLKKGGKSISASFGCLLGLMPVWQPLVTLIAIYVFFFGDTAGQSPCDPFDLHVYAVRILPDLSESASGDSRGLSVHGDDHCRTASAVLSWGSSHIQAHRNISG